MNALPFLESFLIILAASVLVGLVSRPLRLPSVVGFLLTGMLIGPTGFQLVPDRGIIGVFAEFGVVMLLFFVGLEFSLPQIRHLGRPFLLGGTLQFLLTAGAITALLTLNGVLRIEQRVFLGCVAVMSSTAVILKMLTDRGELDSSHGRLAIGVSLFQDFSFVLIAVLTPLLAGAPAGSFAGLVSLLLVKVLAIAAAVFGLRWVLPLFLRSVAAMRVREVFLMSSLLVCLAMASLTFALGFSYALGAFLAGLLISESEYSHEVVADVASFRDLFTSMFFISAGMLVDLGFLSQHVGTVAGLGFGLIVLKSAVVYAVARVIGLSPRTAFLSAAVLGQVGEFSFVLFGLGQSSRLLEGSLTQYFLSASVLTMLISPLLIKGAPHLYDRLTGLAERQASLDDPHGGGQLSGHVIIVGYGLNGRNVARVLRETGIPYLVVEGDGSVVRRARQEGAPGLFGDATRKDILRRAAVQDARLMVVAVSDPQASRSVVALARGLNPSLYIIVRTRGVHEVEELTNLGANEVIPEEFETSIEIFTRVLTRFHLPRNLINAQIKVIRDENYAMLRGLPQSSEGLERLTQVLAAGTSDTFLVTDGSLACRRTIGEVNLTEQTGVIIIAVVRGDRPIVTPPSDFRIEPADALVLVGTHAAMDAAFDYLTPGQADQP